MALNSSIFSMLSFRILTYGPMICIVRRRGTITKTRVQAWKKPSYSRSSNPGIQRRLGIMESEDQGMAEFSDVDDTEFDFMDVNKMHDFHESEEIKMKDMKQLKIVGNKYFKPEKGLNLLTWSEKEQIQYLHNSDGTTWTVEKLAQCFPASETTIKKILKSKWHPHDASRVLKHDLAVQKNWELLQSGKVEVDSELKAHLLQFTQRRIPVAHRPDTGGMFRGANTIPKPKQSEFGSIIESYKLLKSKDVPEDDVEDPYILQRTCDTSSVPKGDSFLLQRQESGSRRGGGGGGVTLDKYREKILRAVKKGCENSPDAKLMISGLNKHEDMPETAHDASSDIAAETLRDPPAAPIPLVAEANSDLPKDPPERIRVPANKWRKGCTFKIGDCYYDDDGGFLYRVPGMK